MSKQLRTRVIVCLGGQVPGHSGDAREWFSTHGTHHLHVVICICMQFALQETQHGTLMASGATVTSTAGRVSQSRKCREVTCMPRAHTRTKRSHGAFERELLKKQH
jgi:hypothetical protein